MTHQLDCLLDALPDEVRAACAPLFEALPLSAAMPELCPSRRAPDGIVNLAHGAISQPAMQSPELAAGIWLYVDELERSHHISQGIATPTGSFWHAIMHRREGDFGNSKYWLRAAGAHPAMRLIGEYDPYAFVDLVARAPSSGNAELIETQRREWAALFGWCASNLYRGV